MSTNTRVHAYLNAYKHQVYAYLNIHEHQSACLPQCLQTPSVYLPQCQRNTRECVATSTCRKCQHMPLPRHPCDVKECAYLHLPRFLCDVKECVCLPRCPCDVKECVCLHHALVTSKSVCAYLNVLCVSNKRAERVDPVQGPQFHCLVMRGRGEVTCGCTETQQQRKSM